MSMAAAFGCLPLLTNSRRRAIGRGRMDRQLLVAPAWPRFCSSCQRPTDKREEAGSSRKAPGSCLCGLCGKRGLLGGISSSSLAALLPAPPAAGKDGGGMDFIEERGAAAAPSSRPGWYKELYAWTMARSMKAYEAEVARYKSELFAGLQGEGKKILELGVGTGPNIKYYASAADVVVGVDPNERMEKYSRAMAADAGLSPAQFNFIQGVAEALPVRDDSMDAVVGTLVLCSVPDVDAALKEVKRVLKPGGLYIFIEHVAAQDGTSLRLLQRVLDPLQQFVADGCHLARETGKSISQAGFSDAHINTTSIDVLSIVSPHIYGFAYK